MGVWPLPVPLRPLLVRIGPVVDLLLDEFAGRNRPERRSRQIEIGIRRDRHDVFVEVFYAFTLPELDLPLVLRLKQVLRVLSPCTVVVFVQNHAIPIRRVDPFVFRLDAAGAWVTAQVVLKRAKTDERPLLLDLLIGQAAR